MRRSRRARTRSSCSAISGRSVIHGRSDGVGQRGQARVGHDGRGRGTRAGVEQRQLAEHVGGAHDRQHVLAAVGGPAPDLHLALEDDVEGVALLALGEHGLPAAVLAVLERCRDRLGGLGGDALEEPRPRQDLVHAVCLPCCDCCSAGVWQITRA